MFEEKKKASKSKFRKIYIIWNKKQTIVPLREGTSVELRK
jgi:hypothetical protein